MPLARKNFGGVKTNLRCQVLDKHYEPIPGLYKPRHDLLYASASLNLLYLSTSCLWWQAVAGRTGVQSSHALRMNARRTWRHREGWRNVHNSAIRRARSPSRPCGRVTAGVHGCPRGGAPLRHPTASRDAPVAAHGRRKTPSLHIPRAAMPGRLSSFRLLAMASPPRDARRKLLI
jgi:hypothetical protein